MSVDGNGNNEPHGGGGEIIAFGGPMYDETTARKMLEEVVLVEAEDAEDGEAVVGFDPDDAALDNLYYFEDDYFFQVEITPTLYFANKGRCEDVPLLDISRCFNNKGLGRRMFPPVGSGKMGSSRDL